MKNFIVLGLALLSTQAFAHSGRTDANGCHTEKATGIYHCHNSGATTSPTVTPIYTPPVYVPPVTTPVVETPIYTPPVVTEPTYTPPVVYPTIPVDTNPDFTAPGIENKQDYTFQYFRDYQNTTLLDLHYEGFTLWVDCTKRAAYKFEYQAQFDTGTFPRLDNFEIDKNVPEECQQISAKPYGRGYDRGHLVAANHMDFSDNAIRESNLMTNILPQAQNMNRGAWLATEEITECYRDLDDLTVIGGVIWGNNTKDDYFVKSHGVATPDSFWKIIIRSDGDAIAWNVPNKSTSTRANLNKYLITVADLEKLTGESFNVANKKKKLTKSWVLPIGCDKG